MDDLIYAGNNLKLMIEFREAVIAQFEMVESLVETTQGLSIELAEHRLAHELNGELCEGLKMQWPTFSRRSLSSFRAICAT